MREASDQRPYRAWFHVNVICRVNSERRLVAARAPRRENREWLLHKYRISFCGNEKSSGTRQKWWHYVTNVLNATELFAFTWWILCYMHCVWNFFKWKKKNRGENAGEVGVPMSVREKRPLGGGTCFCCQTDWPMGQVNPIFMVHCASWPLASLELKPSECKKFLKKRGSW